MVKIDGDVYSIDDEQAFMRAFVALIEAHGGEWQGWLDWYDNKEARDHTGTFSHSDLVERTRDEVKA